MTAVVVRLWQMSIQACPLIVIVYLAGILLKRYPKLYSYALWALVGLRLLCPVLIPSPFSLQPDLSDFQSMAVGWEQASRQDETVFTVSGLSESGKIQSSILNPFSAGGAATDMGVSAEPEDEANRKFHVLTVVYICGAAFFVLFYLIQYLSMKKRISRAVCEKENIWLCEKIQSPFVMGVVSPKIYLPYHIEGQAKRHIINHEKSHIRHHDPLIRFVGLLCICLHWWNPLVWLAVNRMNRDMEMFCDEGFLISAPLPEKKAYAETLLRFAAGKSGFSMELAFGESNTEERVRNLLTKKKKSVFVICIVIIFAVFCAVLFMTVPNVLGFAENEDYEAAIPENGQASGSGDAMGHIDTNGEADTNEENDTNGETDTKDEGQIIESQTFDVEFNQLGYVTFASYSPNLDLSPYADVTFKLLSDGVEFYAFPTVYETEVREDEWRFISLDAVAFADINEDGYTDVLTIATYTDLPEETEFMEARIFTGYGENDFAEEIYLEEAYNQSRDKMSISDLKEFIAKPENQDYYVGKSIYGRWLVTDYRTPGIYGMSQDEIDWFLGRKIEYGRYWYRLEGDEDGYVVDGYKLEVMTPDECRQYFGIEDMEFSPYSNNIKCYTLENARRSYGKDYPNDTIFGQFFYMTSDHTGVVVLDGVMFILERQ